LGSSSYIPAERRCAGVAAPAADPLLASVRPAQRQSNILTNTDWDCPAPPGRGV